MRNYLACAVRFVRAPPVNKLHIPPFGHRRKRSSPALWRLLWHPPAHSKTPTMTQNVTHTVNRFVRLACPRRKPQNDQRRNIGVRLHGRTPRAFQTQKSNDGCNVPSQKSEDTRTILRAFRPPSEPIAPILLLGVVHTSIMGAAQRSVPIRKG